MNLARSLLFLLCGLTGLLAAQIGIYQHGTVVRMHMGDCILAQRGFMATFGVPATATGQESCPEYTLVSDSVVYVIVGKSSNHLIPLAENIDFRLRKNELAVRIDDTNRETRFTIKEMVVRSDWERMQRHMDEQKRASQANETQR